MSHLPVDVGESEPARRSACRKRRVEGSQPRYVLLLPAAPARLVALVPSIVRIIVLCPTGVQSSGDFLRIPTRFASQYTLNGPAVVLEAKFMNATLTRGRQGTPARCAARPTHTTTIAMMETISRAPAVGLETRMPFDLLAANAAPALALDLSVKGLGGHACLCSPGVVPLSILPDALGGLGGPQRCRCRCHATAR